MSMRLSRCLDFWPTLQEILDVRFEAHFDLAVRTVASVASQHADLQVVEWCFNCLAWLFKYLSRVNELFDSQDSSTERTIGIDQHYRAHSG
ncbi:hypothetical protein MRB53_039935 [Persea americana]|nr:hypothetical protein MRB53_039935 [Persea americana]